jgi:hypothetical protein
MQKVRFIGLDVHKDSITVAVADGTGPAGVRAADVAMGLMLMRLPCMALFVLLLATSCREGSGQTSAATSSTAAPSASSLADAGAEEEIDPARSRILEPYRSDPTAQREPPILPPELERARAGLSSGMPAVESGSAQGWGRLWPESGGKEITHLACGSSAAVIVASKTDDDVPPTVAVWDLERMQRRVLRVPPRAKSIRGAAWTRNQRAFVVTRSDPTRGFSVAEFDTRTTALLRSRVLTTPAFGVEDADRFAFWLDPPRLATIRHRAVVVWDLDTGQLRWERELSKDHAEPERPPYAREDPESITFSADGTTLLVASDLDAVWLLDANGGDIRSVLRAEPALGRRLLWAPNAKEVFSAWKTRHRGAFLEAWDVSLGSLGSEVVVAPGVPLAASPDGVSVLLDTGAIYERRGPTLREGFLSDPSWKGRGCWHASGGWAALTGTFGFELVLLRAGSPAVVTLLPVAERLFAYDADLDWDGRAEDARAVRVWPATSKRVLGEQRPGLVGSFLGGTD